MTTATQETEFDISARLVRIETRLDGMATKEDLASLAGELRTEMATRFGEQDAKMEARFGELETKITAHHGELKSDVAGLRIDNANLRAEVVRWIVGTVAVSSTIVASLVTVIDRLLG